MKAALNILWQVTLVALVALVPAGVAGAITIDGVLAPSEWGAAEVIIADPDEATIPDSWDVETIYMAGGYHFHMAVQVWNDDPQLTPSPPVVTGRAFFNFDFDETAAPTHYFGVTLNDGKGFPPGELHLIEYADATRTTFTDLGMMDWAIGTALEMRADWTLFPAGVIPDDHDLVLTGFSFLYNNGGIQMDDDQTNATVTRNDPVHVVPEPLTMTGFVLALAGLGLHLRTRRKNERDA